MADRLDLDAVRNEADNQERLFGGYGDTGDWYYAANRAVANTRRVCDEVERLQHRIEAAQHVLRHPGYLPRAILDALDALDGD